MKNQKLHYTMVMLSMCGLVGMALGICMGTAGLFNTSIAEELNVSRGSVSLMYTITALASAVTGLFVPTLLKKENMLKPLILAGIAMTVGGTFLNSLANNLFMFYLFSVIRGAGCGLLSFVLATTVINNWFYARNGLMVSIAMAFSGLPGVLLSSLFAGIIEGRGWRFAYIFVGIFMLIFALPALVYPIKLRPQNLGMQPYGYEDYLKYREENKEKVVIQQSDDHINYFSPEMILLVLFTTLVCIIASVLQHLPSFAVSVGFAASVGALMSSSASAANIVSKLMYGVLTDKLGPHKTSILCACISFLAVILIISVHTVWAVVLGAFLFGFTFANSSSAMSILTRETYGMQNYTRVYPLIAFVGAATNAGGATLMGILYDTTGSYYTMFFLCLALQALVLTSLFLLMKKKKK